MTDAAIWSTIAAALAVQMLGVVSPGPNFVICSRNALARSRAAGLATVGGILAANAVFITLGLFGLIAVLRAFEWLFLALKLAGGLYLVWLGFRLWRGAGRPLPAVGGGDGAGLAASFREGLVTNLSNVKALAYYFSFFALVFDPGLPVWAQLTLAGLMLCVSGAWYAFVVLVLSTPAINRLYRRAQVWIERVVGALLAVLGVRLAVGPI